MPLRSCQIKILADYLNRFSSRRVSKFVQFGKSAFSCDLGKDAHLVIDLDNRSPEIFIVDELEALQNISSPISSFLRKRLSGASIDEVAQENEDRVIRIRFLSSNDIYEPVEYSLIVELIPTKANLAILDEEDKVLFVLRPNTLLDKRPLLTGIQYQPPLKANAITEDNIEFDVDAYFSSCQESLTKVYQEARKAKYDATFRRLKSQIKSEKRKIVKIQDDIEKAKTHLRDADYGSYIYTYIDNIHQGDDHFDFYGENVELDPLKTPSQNAEMFFKRYKKAKTAIALGEENLLKTKKNLQELEALLRLMESCDLASLPEIAVSFDLERGNKKKAMPKPHLPHFLQIGGHQLAYGSNAKENEFLTFSYSRSRDCLWFHPKLRPGSHVLLFETNPSPRTIEIAAELALISSQLEDGEVQYARRDTLRKGEKPGQVILGHYSSCLIKSISDEVLEAYLQSRRDGDE